MDKRAKAKKGCCKGIKWKHIFLMVLMFGSSIVSTLVMLFGPAEKQPWNAPRRSAGGRYGPAPVQLASSAEDFVAHFDRNGDGVVDARETEALVAQDVVGVFASKHPSWDVAEAAARVVGWADGNGDGVLEVEEVRGNLMDAMQKLWEACAPYTEEFKEAAAGKGDQEGDHEEL